MIKKLNILVLKAFLGPFVATFFISLFLFLMHFLWKYIDDLVGKGLEWHVIGRLIFYSMADLVPMALPLAVMISSLMTFGNLSESYELVAIKSAGVPLYRAMWPAFVVMLLLALTTFYFSNIVIPRANLEAKSLLYDVRQKKPAFNLKEGTFYNEIDGYQILVGKKYDDNQTIEDVLIYEQKPGQHILNIIKAKRGKMNLSDDKRILFFTLEDGTRYDEMVEQPSYFRSYPSNIMKFKRQKLTFDLSALDLKLTGKESWGNDHRIMNIRELQFQMDTVNMSINRFKKYVKEFLTPYFLYNDTFLLQNQASKLTKEDILSNFPKSSHAAINERALGQVRMMSTIANGQNESIKGETKEYNRFAAEWHRKFTLSIVIILLFFISAPLGAIIRKGGLGLPLVISVLMFVVYYVLNLIGEKIGKEGIIPLWTGMWLSTFFLLPLGLFLVYKASRDSAVLNMESYSRFFKKLIPRKWRKSEILAQVPVSNTPVE